MQRISKVFTSMSAILALAFCLASCTSNVDDDHEKWTPSGIYTESSAYYINVDPQSAPSDGNGAW